MRNIWFMYQEHEEAADEKDKALLLALPHGRPEGAFGNGSRPRRGPAEEDREAALLPLESKWLTFVASRFVRNEMKLLKTGEAASL